VAARRISVVADASGEGRFAVLAGGLHGFLVAGR
jgi:hypothetical protein